MKKAIYILIIIAASRFIFLKFDQVSYGAGVLAPDNPEQQKISTPEVFDFKEYAITPLAKFHIKAKVLSRENYHLGRESDLSPVDLALGWGRMSDEGVLESIKISQSNRWYYWRTDEPPIPVNEISGHSANMHLIPENKQVASAIKGTRKGDIVEFSGSLIRVDAADGWQWSSSLSRSDTGASSCELIWVDSYKIQNL